jgi:hypothetical protein
MNRLLTLMVLLSLCAVARAQTEPKEKGHHSHWEHRHYQGPQ